MAAACPSRDVLRRLTGRWGMLVLWTLAAGPQRFSGLRRHIGGVSERMLAQTLQGLESDGMVLRRDFGTVPPHVEYELTPPGPGGGRPRRCAAGLDRGPAAADRQQLVPALILHRFPNTHAARAAGAALDPGARRPYLPLARMAG